MRKTGNRLLAVLAAVSMTVSLLPANAVTAAQTDKAQSVQKVTTAQTGGKAQSVQAAQSTVTLPTDAVSEIQKYKALLDAGVLTEEEFSAKKRQLLGI